MLAFGTVQLETIWTDKGVPVTPQGQVSVLNGGLDPLTRLATLATLSPKGGEGCGS
jgi:hypothetical protein